MFKQILMLVGAGLMMSASAFADEAPLTNDQAARFVASLESAEQLGDELEADGKIENLVIDNEPKAGEAFKPYSKAVAVLKKEHPGDHARLGAAVKPHGFSADVWGQTGDKVMVAYLALTMEQESPGAMAQMKAMDPSMLAMLPPEMKARMDHAIVMMETIENAPAADKKAVASVKDDLDAFMTKSRHAHD